MAAGLSDDMINGLIQSVGPDTARDLVCFFLEESRERLHRMEDLTATDALAELTREAHSLKSAAATYGADTLSELSRDLEMACRDGEPDAIIQKFQTLADAAGGLLDALEARVSELTASR